MSRTQAYAYFLAAFAIIGLLALSLYLPQRPSGIPGAEAENTSPIPQPPYTEAVQAQLAASSGFQVLVSYTGRGFEPAKIIIPQGDTIRFTNNSHSDLWVASAGATSYPAGQEGCSASAFDSCHALKSGEFWEFTFTQTGTWSYLNNMDKMKEGTVTVQ